MFDFKNNNKHKNKNIDTNQHIDEYNKKYTVPYGSIELSDKRNMILADKVFKSFSKDDTQPNNPNLG